MDLNEKEYQYCFHPQKIVTVQEYFLHFKSVATMASDVLKLDS